MRSDSGRPQHPTAKEKAEQVGRQRTAEAGRDIGDGDHEVKPPREGFAPYPGAVSPGATPNEQKTSGAHYGGPGGTKITAEDQGEVDARGSAGASGPPGSSSRSPEQRSADKRSPDKRSPDKRD